VEDGAVASARDVGCVVLAGGEGRRFGGPKQLANLAGRPLLEHALSAAANAPVGRVVVVLGANEEAVRSRVELHGARPVVCGSWRDGMAESLKAGIEHLRDLAAVAVMLGDQPLVTSAAIARVLAARGDGAPAVRATYAGVPGHPVVLERSLFSRVMALEGDVGAREILEGVAVRAVACDDVGDPADVDSAADLAALEARI
jgi:molybdenum cofactor cytidylyltransferase